MKTLRLLLPLLLLMTAACNNIGDSLSFGPSMSGLVRDAANAPVDGATVSLAGHSTKSVADGKFFLFNLPRGAQTLTVEKSGYITYTATVTVTESSSETIIHLQRQ